ncbi:MAG: serine/threonine protein kinase, partial [Myxococcota bacterium]|nr:serine/threonine protein kinase [Myxococcota bacterium]
MANSPARAALDVGSVIAGTYTLEALIGRGGMGSVFLATHNRLPGKRVAIKLLHIELHDDDVIARFRREALIASDLDHPNIVRVDDYNVTADGTPYLILEYLQGESLAQRIQRGPIALDHAMAIIRQVGSAVAAAHRAGIVHRDLKPQNIFLVGSEIDGRPVEVAKVLDFGISKIRGSQTVKTQDNALLGTPQYMAPEQATGQHTAVDERTDVFALGAIVYEMLCGHPAFSGESIPEVVFKVVYEQPAPLELRAPGVPADVVRAVSRAMAKPSDDRFASVSTFVEALTGMPLAPPRASLGAIANVGLAHKTLKPALAAPGGSRPTANESGSDAFANTIGSGDH